MAVKIEPTAPAQNPAPKPQDQEGTTGAAVVQPPAAAAPVAAPAPKPALYISRIPIWNPDQKKYLQDTPQELVIDNFWQVQLDAGILKKVQ